ncbi:MAG: DUF2510 domain-containing protein [Acidimicrobiales bacterium]
MSDQTGSWQPDPFGRNEYRYWDGSEWTEHVSNAGEVGTDPAVAGEAAAAGTAPSDPAGTPAEPTPGAEAAAEPTPAVDAGVEPSADTPAAPAEPTPDTPADPPTNVPAETPAAAVDPDATTSLGAMPPPAPVVPGGPGGPADPPPPTDGGDGSGAGGSNVVGFVIGAVILALILGGAAWFFLLRDDGDGDLRTEVIAALRSEAGLTQSQAECVADELDDSIGLEGIADGINADRAPTAAEQIAIENAFVECGVSEAPPETTTTTEDTNDTTTTTESASPTTSIPAFFIDAFVEGMMSESNLTETQARCFAEEFFAIEGLDIAEFIAAGDDFSAIEDMLMTDTDLMFSMFAIFDTCDIDLTALGGIEGTGDTYGDDPALDALWDACEGGDFDACDDLYFSAPLGSGYETFGDTCGGRQPEGTGNLCSIEFG